MQRRRGVNKSHQQTLFRGSKHSLKLHFLGEGKWPHSVLCSGLPEVEILEPKNHAIFAKGNPFMTLHPEKFRPDTPSPIKKFTGHSVVPLTLKLRYRGKKFDAKLETITLSHHYGPFVGTLIMRAILPNGVKIPVAAWNRENNRIPIKQPNEPGKK